MHTKRDDALQIIFERLGIFANFVSNSNRAGFYDINKNAERLFIYILNITYGINLRDMNIIQKNYPAIDLGDYESRVCFQITSESTNKKFRETVLKFKEQQLNQKFDKLFFLIISNKQPCSLTDPNLATEVVNLEILCAEINKIDDEKVFLICDYLEKNLINRTEQSGSILPSNLTPTLSIPAPNTLISYLKTENYPIYIEQLLDDLKTLAQILSKLTQNQKELLFYIIEQGHFSHNSYGYIDENTIIIPVDEVWQKFGPLARSISDVLIYQNLITINDEYEFNRDGRYMTVFEPYFERSLEDVNIFYVLKKAYSSNMLKRIIIDCDFSNL